MRSKLSMMGLVMGLGVLLSAAHAEEAATTETAPSTGLDMTQGKFLMLVVHDAEAQGLFEGPVTASDASEKLGNLGLAPEGGWQVTQELTREVLESAYKNLLGVIQDAPEEGEEVAAEDTSGMTIAELIDLIVAAVNKATAKVTNDRTPVSTTSQHW